MDKKPIKGYNGRYWIDADGNIDHVYKTCVRRMKPRRHRGVLVIALTDANGKRHTHKVAHLVSDTFLPPRPQGHVVYHKNGNKGDPSLGNLGVISRTELGKMTGHQSKRKAVVKFDWRTQQAVEVYRSARQAAKANYMSYQTIMDRCNGKVKGPIAPDGYIYQWDTGDYLEVEV